MAIWGNSAGRAAGAALLIGVVLAAGQPAPAPGQPVPQRRWLAGDHHVHSHYSARYPVDPARPDAPPQPVIGGDADYPIVTNLRMGRQYGLAWMVSTDHGGPGHSALNHDRAWPDVVAARAAMPDMVLFYGMEFDVPGGEHASLILPAHPGEREMLRSIEAGYGKREAHPPEPGRNTKARMIAALRDMAALPRPPLLIANHPSRTATGAGIWGLHSPQEFREWQAAAPGVVIGMEGAPGHQAARPAPGLDARHRSRGLYGDYPTLGGFDQMTARLGGGWDWLLGMGLRWTITATSDSHRNWRAGGADFWPGEYAKTWVHAAATPQDILDGLRHGRVFAATGDLAAGLDFTAARIGGGDRAAMGDRLAVSPGETIVVRIAIDPVRVPNGSGAVPRIDHVDLIAGGMPAASDAAAGRNPTARVVRRFTADQWQRADGRIVMTARVTIRPGTRYLRLRATNTGQGEPKPDPPGENPWADLWLYANPIYLGDAPSP